MALQRAAALALLLIIAAIAPSTALDTINTAAKPKSNEAYATLVYGDDFVLGARVLGQSLRESGTTR